ncbi:MAG: AMP-binding protein, partial [Casimicrobiaceae bacterium]
MQNEKLILDIIYDHEATLSGHVWLTQPTGGGAVTTYTWGQVMAEARRMANHLQSQGVTHGDRVAILSKNCAHFIMAELAIWMAGGTTVAIFPTETAETIRYVLGHSEPKLLFVGKLDTWAQQSSAVPAGLPCIAFPLAPDSAKKAYPGWDDIVRTATPIAGKPARRGEDIAMIMYTSGSTGMPKGVMHRFDRITACTDGMLDYVRESIGAHEEIRVLS